MYPRQARDRRQMSAALLIDVVILWTSVAAVGFIAYRRGPKVMTSSRREGAMDFISIAPRIALAWSTRATSPPSFLRRSSRDGWDRTRDGLESPPRWSRGPRPWRTGGRLFDRVRGAEGGRIDAQVLAYVIVWALFAFQRLLLCENPLHAGPVRLISGRRSGSGRCPCHAVGEP